jgi:hypothetical protein
MIRLPGDIRGVREATVPHIRIGQVSNEMNTGMCVVRIPLGNPRWRIVPTNFDYPRLWRGYLREGDKASVN